MNSIRAHSPSRLFLLTGVGLALGSAGCAHDPGAQTVPFPWPVEPSMQVQHGMTRGQAKYLQGRTLDRQGAWAKSEQAYRRAIAADAGHVEAHNALGVSLARQGRLQEARTVLLAAVKLAPTRAHLHSNLGQVLLRGGQARDALISLRRAQQLDPLDPVSRSLLEEAASLVAETSERAEDEGARTGVAGAGFDRTMAVSGQVPLNQPAINHVLVPQPITSIQVLAPGSAAGSLKLEKLNQPTLPALAVAGPTPDTPPAAPMFPVEGPGRETAAGPARLELSNGNGQPGLAGRLRRHLARQGVQTHWLSNDRPFRQERTVVRYRFGHETAAQRIADTLPNRPPIEPTPGSGQYSDIRVVLGHDWPRSATCATEQRCLYASAQTAVQAYAPVR